MAGTDTNKVTINVNGTNVEFTKIGNILGPAGKDGIDGKSIYAKTVDPWSVSSWNPAVAGDLFLNTTTGILWSAKAGAVTSNVQNNWTKVGELAGKITVDSALSSTSTNPVQNKVIKSALDGKAGSSHSHSSLTNSSGRVFNVPTGGSGGEQKTLVITDDLNAYQPAGNYASSTHKHPISDINDLQSTIDGIYTDMGLQDEAIAGKADSVHTHEISNINGLQSALNGKSNLDHNHDSVYQSKGDYATNDALKSYVTGTTFINYTTFIEGEVNKKANVSHDHDISDINGLQSALDGKSNTGHTHSEYVTGTDFNAYTSWIEGEVSGKAASNHTHIIANVSGLQSALDGKSGTGHTHSISNISGLQSAIDGKAASSHTHSDLVPKNHNNRFYPFIGSAYRNSNYKITLPISGRTSSSHEWMMITMELILGGSYSNGANGTIFLSYYFRKDQSNHWYADDVRAIGIGNKLADNSVRIQYDISNPGIFYVHSNNSVYNSFSIQNLTANDTATNFDFTKTTIEPVDSIPSGLASVPLTCLDSKGDNKLYVNNTAVSLDGHAHTSVADIYNNKTTTFAYSQDGLGYDSYTWLAGWNGYELRAVNKSQFAKAGHTHSYLPLAGGILTGPLGFNSNYLIKPVADFRTRNSTFTGAITITLPANIPDTMVSMWIDVYNYVTNTSFSVHVGGYPYTGSTWQHSPFAMVYGATHTIRLGHNGTNFVIYIGETNSTWSYPQISVRDVILGYTPGYDKWKEGWNISFSTSFSNVSATINNYAWTTKNFSMSFSNGVLTITYNS